MSEHSEPQKGEEQALPRPARRRRSWLLAVIPLGIAAAALAFPLASPLFPAQEVESCTVKDKGSERVRRNIAPSRPTDCGTFTARKTVACTSDPGKQVQLLPGFTYDLTVRGPRVPLISRPVIESATLSAGQAMPIKGFLEAEAGLNTDVTELPDAVRELREQFDPEHLRAYDYQQPPYDSLCDIMRPIMTSIGVQSVAPSQADELLTPPLGVEARTPKLPCEGFQCSSHAAG